MSDTTSVMSNEETPSPPPTNRRNGALKKRRSTRGSLVIADLSEIEQLKARKFDLDGDGELDDIEQTMMRYDKDGDGNLGLEEIHAIVSEQLRAHNKIGALKKVIIFLTCFTLILAVSNLGTSLASAMLVKEMSADTTTGEMKLKGTQDVMGTQSSAETFQAMEMDVETRRARRAMVVESLIADPFGEHAHRRLGKKSGGSACTGRKCDKDIQFDTNVMRQADVEQIKSKCDVGRVVNVKRSFNGAGEDSSCLCKSGSSIIVKEKKTVISKNGPKNKAKGKVRNGFEMVVVTDDKDTVFDCDGRNCYMSGSNLRQKHGEPCNLNHGSDDCEAGLMCVQDANDVTLGKCLAGWDGVWYVDWDNYHCVQDCVGGPNCGGAEQFWEEEFATYQACCDAHLSYLSGGYRECVPDLDYYLGSGLGKGEDCSDSRICGGNLRCQKSPLNGSDRWYCV